MALTVGELVAYIRADGTQFDQQIDRSGQKLTSLGTLVTGGTKTIATAFTAATATVGALGVAVFKVGADYNRLQQSSRAALSTLLGGAEAANAQMDKLDDFARNSPFAKQVFITAQQQLLGFGVQAERVLPILDAVQNAVAAVGGGNEEVSQVTYALAQMQGQGKLTGETLNQLGQYGIDAAGIIGKEMGKTGAEIRELASKPGGIAVEKVWDPLVTGLMDRFGGATANIKQQFDGAADRIKGAWRDIGSAIAAPFIDPNGGGRAVEWANKVADSMRAAEAKIKPLVDLLVARFTPALNSVTPALDRVRSAINGWDLSQVNGQLDSLTKYAPLIAPVAAGLLALGGNSLGLGALGLSLNPVVAAIAALVAVSPGLRAAGSAFFDALAPLVPVATELGGVLVGSLLGVLDELTPAIRDILLVGADLAVLFGTGLASSAVSLVSALVPLAGVVADVVGLVAELPTPVLAAVAAFTLLNGLNIAPVVANIASAFAGMRENVAASRGVLESTGQTAGVMNTALLSARAGAAGLGSALWAAFGGGIGIAIAAVSTAIAFFVSQSAESRRLVDELTASIDTNTGAWTDNSREIALNALRTKGALDAARDAGLNLSDVVDAALDPTGSAMDRIARSAEAAHERVRELGDSGEGYSDAIAAADAYQTVLNALGWAGDQATEAQQKYQESQEAGVGSTRSATDATRGNTDALRENMEALREAGDANLSAAEAAARYADAQERSTAAVQAKKDAEAEHTRVMEDGNATEEQRAEATRSVEQATRDADSALRDQVRSAFTDIDAKRRQNATTGELVTAVYSARESFIAQRIAMGDTQSQASALADSYGLIPESVATTVQLIDYVSGDLDTIVRRLQDFNGKTYTAIARVDQQGNTRATYFPGSGLTMSHDGNLLEFMHDGGVRGRKLTPMAQVAQMVAPNSWRVVGDRAVDDEAYIPINHSVRSLAILDETARRLGKVVVPMHDGALARTGTTGSPALAAGGGSGGDVYNVRIEGVAVDQTEETARAVVRAIQLARRGRKYQT